MDLKEISRAALLTALALALPVVFHAIRLGSVFLPMYLPLLAGGFLLSPRWALTIGLLTPLISAVAFGMPPLLPPVAVWMGIELGLMGLLASWASRRTRLPVALILAGVLILGRGVYAALVFATAQLFELPPRLLTFASLAASWPGLILAMVAVPATVGLVRRGRADGAYQVDR